MKLLLIDDDNDVRKMARLCLSAGGRFEVWETESALVGLALARSQRPDVLIVDMMMPHMDGRKCLHFLKLDPRTRSIPVIVMTADPSSRHMRDCLRAGALGLIEKPFSPLHLADQVEVLLFGASASPNLTQIAG